MANQFNYYKRLAVQNGVRRGDEVKVYCGVRQREYQGRVLMADRVTANKDEGPMFDFELATEDGLYIRWKEWDHPDSRLLWLWRHNVYG